ncbi:sensor histidine kinase [Mobilicoccus pelagius]|uniref:Sensor-like histidine kinase SenX3 n=1 Tax=Mobilicoccus pelagius NBRC 104925 TaxID=1089455 RepID=H5UNP5_9MICO|nr:HAMP domain-containing sensor histidine kinase [Mobilicoccus pelagius]GAB47353.1 putative two-component histidine kinase [Mobilicoccus pelagius NBRC 104925]
MTSSALLTAAVVVTAAALLVAVGCALAWRRERALVALAHREAQEARELLAARLERPSVFSHEVRTPLALVKGAAELLAEETPGPLTDMQREFVTTITSNADQAIGMAENMLTEARLSDRLFRLDLSRVDLRQTAQDTVQQLRRIHDTPIRLAGAGRPVLVDGDPGLLRQALVNVVTNAVRHAGPGATVHVEVGDHEGQAVVAVHDDGAGMTEEERASMFEPFAVGASPRSGTGLGMMITESILEEHHGRVLVDTVSGHGTTVFVTLPCRRPDARGGNDAEVREETRR